MIDFRNMDCMELMAEFEDKHFDLAIVDPPYGIERFKKVATNYSDKDVHAKRFQGMETVNNTKPSKEYFDELFRVSKNQIIWGANNFVLPPSEYFCCWNKDQAMPNFATLEYAWVSMGLKKPAKLFNYSIHKHNQTDKVHPTQKPIPLYTWILATYAKEGDLILDTHVGSASSLIACNQLGFDVVGCEINKDYFEKAQQRIKEETAQLSLF